jgi:hypothetical protein
MAAGVKRPFHASCHGQSWHEPSAVIQPSPSESIRVRAAPSPLRTLVFKRLCPSQAVECSPQGMVRMHGPTRMLARLGCWPDSDAGPTRMLARLGCWPDSDAGPTRMLARTRHSATSRMDRRHVLTRTWSRADSRRGPASESCGPANVPFHLKRIHGHPSHLDLSLVSPSESRAAGTNN